MGIDSLTTWFIPMLCDDARNLSWRRQGGAYWRLQTGMLQKTIEFL